jgi:hypothetical protein
MAPVPLATFLFHQIDQLVGRGELLGWKEFCEHVDPLVPEVHRRAWKDVRTWLLPPDGDSPLPSGVLDLRVWTRRMARYSFLIESLDTGFGAS